MHPSLDASSLSVRDRLGRLESGEPSHGSRGSLRPKPVPVPVSSSARRRRKRPSLPQARRGGDERRAQDRGHHWPHDAVKLIPQRGGALAQPPYVLPVLPRGRGVVRSRRKHAVYLCTDWKGRGFRLRTGDLSPSTAPKSPRPGPRRVSPPDRREPRFFDRRPRRERPKTHQRAPRFKPALACFPSPSVNFVFFFPLVFSKPFKNE